MITLDTLTLWLTAPVESERLEFKEAQQQFDRTKLLRYCVALANERGGNLVLGVTDKPPRRVVGTRAFSGVSDLNAIKALIVERLGIRVDVSELSHPDGRVLVFEIPSRPTGHPLELEGAFLMRVGESLMGMTLDQVQRICAEGQADWFSQPAKQGASAYEVIALLDTQIYFDLYNLPYPTTREGVLARLAGDKLIIQADGDWTITNLAAILLAKQLDTFSPALARKAPRVVIYEGIDKTQTRNDRPGNRGYAVGFKGLVAFVHAAAPLNRSIEQVVREEVKMFPMQALRELIANALVHQDFLASGTSVMIELYADRVEISNPGIPEISVNRFIDEYRSRNERLADMMRRLGICEEKGSGIDKVVKMAELSQLPAPDFRIGESRTTAILFAHQDFAAMSKTDRIRACYQHCCLMYVSNQRMTKQSLRARFGLPESKAATVSQVIGATKEKELIRADKTDSTSSRYARYLPFWA
jgi:ATP-dependent DNA helicase RecG